MSDTQLLTLTAASERFAVSNYVLRRRIRAGELRAFTDPLDRRACLLDAAEVAAYARPRPRPAPRRHAQGLAADVPP